MSRCLGGIVTNGGYGVQGRFPSLGPIFFIFMQFLGETGQNNKLAPPLYHKHPILWESWIHHWWHKRITSEFFFFPFQSLMKGLASSLFFEAENQSKCVVDSRKKW